MNFRSLTKTFIYNFNLNIGALIFALFLLRPLLPQYIKHILFLSFFILVAGVFFLLFRRKTTKRFNSFNYFMPLIVVVIFYIVPISVSSNYNAVLFKEFINVLSVVLFFILLLFIIRQKHDVSLFIKKIILVFIVLGIFGAVIALLKFWFQINNFHFSFLYVSGFGYPIGTSLAVDENFFSLVIIILFIFILNKLFLAVNYSHIIILQLIEFILIVITIFTNSRRGIILCVTFLIILYLFYFYCYIKKARRCVYIRKLKLFLILVGSFFILSYLYWNNRNRYIDVLFVKTKLSKTDINNAISQSFSFLFGIKSDFYDSTNIDPYNPKSGWARANYIKEEIIDGVNSGIVPKGAIGAKISDGIDFFVNSNHSIYYSPLISKSILKNKRYLISIYCFVSKDYDGGNVYLSLEKGEKHIKYTYFDLVRKNSWQKLQYSFEGIDSTVITKLYMQNNGISGFKGMKGYVIFAFPEFKEITFDSGNPYSWNLREFKLDTLHYPQLRSESPEEVLGAYIDSTCYAPSWGGNSYYYFTLVDSLKKSNYVDSVSIYTFCSVDFDGDDVFILLEKNGKWIKRHRYDLHNKGIWQKLSLNVLSTNYPYNVSCYIIKNNAKDFSKLKGHVILTSPELLFKGQYLNKINFGDSLNSKYNVNSFFSFFPSFMMIDTSKSKFIRVMQDGFLGERIDRWRYAIYLYQNEFSIVQKMLGDRYLHTKKFSLQFNDNDGYEYPHNPFLSVLLYSGFFGLLSYLWFLYYVFYYYWKYRKEYWVFGLSFLASFFFAFFSANSPFDPAIVGVFSILPYFIHYYHVKDKAENILIITSK